jgi:hypothetical protein
MKKLIIVFIFIAFVISSVFMITQFKSNTCPTNHREESLHVPEYPSMSQKIVSEHMAGATQVQDISFQTTDTLEEIVAFYKDSFGRDGWKLLGEEDGKVLTFSQREALPIYGALLQIETVGNGLANVSVSIWSGPCTMA